MQRTVHQSANMPRTDFAGGFVNRNHPAYVQCAFAVFVIERERLHFRVHHLQFGFVAIELDFAVESKFHAGENLLCQVATMEPFGEKSTAGSIRELCFKETKIPAFETGDLCRPHFHDDGRHFTGSQLLDGFDVAPVLITERDVMQKVLDGLQAPGLQERSSGRTDAFYIHQGSIEIERHGLISRQPCYNLRMYRIALVGMIAGCLQGQEVRLGIIGTDTSHVTAFASILNNPSSPDYLPGARIVAAYKGGSADVAESASRVDKYAEELKTKWKVDFYSDINTMCKRVDGVLLESVDGRVHLEQARIVIAAHKPLFIDKPLASNLADAREIAKLAKAAGVPWFSASSLRYGELGTSMKIGDALGITTWGPGPIEKHHELELSWYAIHPIELLFTLMGTGCEEVNLTAGKDEDVISGRWKDGRIGSVRTLRPYGTYGAVIYRSKDVVQSKAKTVEGYRPLLVEIVKFFETKQPPVPNDETLEIFAFMDAAQRSKAAGGAPMKLR